MSGPSYSARPVFIFSYNANDPDIVALTQYARAGLGASGPPATAHNSGSGSRTRFRSGGIASVDDWVPTYGPTKHRRGPLRFVPARQAQFGVIPASDDPGATPTVDLSGQALSSLVKAEVSDDVNVVAAPPPRPAHPPRTATLSGSAVRGLYANIVGLNTTSASAPVSVRTSVVPDPGPAPPVRASSVPSAPKQAHRPSALLDSAHAGGGHNDDDEDGEQEDDILVLGSDSGSEDDQSQSADSEVDLIVIDPLTNLPETPWPIHQQTPTPRPEPLLIHQLLPPSAAADEPLGSDTPASGSAAGGGVVPLPPSVPQYVIKPDNPGFRMLLRQGWREGAALGPRPAPGEPQRGLKVPLRAKEKFDRAGLGVEDGRRKLSGKERDELRKEAERNERERRRGGGRGARAIERAQKEEARARRALIGYMNR